MFKTKPNGEGHADKQTLPISTTNTRKKKRISIREMPDAEKNQSMINYGPGRICLGFLGGAGAVPPLANVQ
uniref:Uncharacterized protein n=1 Tax=Romanomermis culicivorax TaxID=13658 RepID=A0A915JEB6_ROMCU